MKTKNDKANVPWKRLGTNWESFIDDEYIPEGFEFCDPMHILKTDLVRVFEYWEEHFAANEIVFEFKSVRQDDRGNECPNIYPLASSWNEEAQIPVANGDSQPAFEHEEGRSDEKVRRQKRKMNRITATERRMAEGGQVAMERRMVAGGPVATEQRMEIGSHPQPGR
jgi:hypothetical protein